MALARLARRAGKQLVWLARRLGLACTTMLSWVQGWGADRLRAMRRGRPAQVETRTARRAALELARDHPSLGARHIARMTGLSRRVAADLKERLRTWRARWVERRARCEWTRAGAVWAMDFTKPKVGIEGGLNRVLVVRDLASGRVLSALATRSEKAEQVARELKRLFDLHGAPLVLKEDNGAPLVASVVRETLGRARVVMMRSPPYTPSYNGSCERSLGWVKVRAVECAAAAGRPGLLTQGDLDEARRFENQYGSPRCARGPSPEAVWSAREPISQSERSRFLAAHARALAAERDRDPEQRTPATIERAAASRVLCELNYLVIRKG